MRKIKKLNVQRVYDLQNSSRTNFYKRVLFPNSNLNIIGLSVHIGSQIMSLNPFKKAFLKIKLIF